MTEVAYNQGFDTKTKASSADEEMTQELIRDYNYLFGLRGVWNQHWTEIAQRVVPMDSYLFQSLSQLGSKGDKRMREVYDSTAILALDRFAAILDSLLTPRNSFWHHLMPDDPILTRDKSTRDWFERTNARLFEQRYAPTANFPGQNQLAFKSIGAYGTGSLLIDDLAGKKGLRYKSVHLSETYLQENHQGIVDAVCRAFLLTARQAMQKFGDACPEQIKTQAEKAPDTEFQFLHWVKPRMDRDPYRKDFKGMAYASYYVSVQGSKCVAEGGYQTFPYAITRYTQATNEAYGRSPAMDALPAIKTLNEEKKTMLKQGHRIVDPVLLAHDDGIVDSFNLEPGSVNAGGVTADGRILIHPLPTGNVQAGKEFMDDERKLINDTFLVNLFQILVETPEMTATEVMERTREKGILLAPTIGRQQSEYLGPMIDRELDVLSRQGSLDPMPPLLKSAQGQYKIRYDSPISRSQKAEWASGALHTIQSLMNVVQSTGDQSVMDYINWDKAAPEIADIYGTPSTWLNDPGKIAQIRASRKQQQVIQQGIQAAPAAAAMMKQTGETSLNGNRAQPLPKTPGPGMGPMRRSKG